MKKIVSRKALWSETAVLVYLGAAKLLLHLIYNGRYGFFRDELYNIICGERLAFGYVDHPPLTPLAARFSQAVFGDSVLALRILPALAGALTVVLAGLIVRKLGGGRFAQAAAAVAAIFSPAVLNFSSMLTNNAFDILFWTLAAYILISIIKDNRPRLWLLFGLVLGAALQNKYSILFFIAALGVGMLLTPARKRLWSPWPWAGAGVALLLILPNLLWQIRHGLPFIELNRNAVLHKNAVLSPLDFFGGQVMEAGTLHILLVLAGLVWLFFSAGAKPVRAFGWAYLGLTVFFIFSGGKTYYIAPIYPLMFAAGAMAVEGTTAKPRRQWIRPAALILLIAVSVPTVPFVVPVLPVEKFIAYEKSLGLASKPAERQTLGDLPQYYADQFGWPEMVETVARVYHGLPEADRREAAIFTQNYGEAAAIDYFGRKLGLPPALSGHNSYWVWGPGRASGAVMIIVGGDARDHEKYFSEVNEAARTNAPYAMPYENNLPIYVCRGLKIPLREIWPRTKEYI